MDSQRFKKPHPPSPSSSRTSSPIFSLFFFKTENPLDAQRYNPSLKSPSSSPKTQHQPLSVSIPDLVSRPVSPVSSLEITELEDSQTVTAVGNESIVGFDSPSTFYRKTSVETLNVRFRNDKLRSRMVSRETLPRAGPVVETAAVIDEEISNATCKIIRPIPSSPILSIFTRPSTPVAPRRSSSPPRSASPLRLLGCCGSSDNFEDDVDYFQEKRERERSGESEAKVGVTHTHEVLMEKSWRQTVYSIIRDQEHATQHLKQKTAV